jgi:hypothetical protein
MRHATLTGRVLAVSAGVLAAIALAVYLTHRARSPATHDRHAKQQPVWFVDRSGDVLGIAMTPAADAGALTLDLVGVGTFAGRVPMSSSSRGTLHATMTARVRRVDGRPGPGTRISWRGTYDLARHAARIAIHVDRPEVDRLFTTQPADPASARVTVHEIVAAVIQNDLRRLAGLMSPTVRGRQTTAELVGRLRAQRIHPTRMRVRGQGRMTWLANGDPLWVQPIIGTADTPSGSRTLKTNLLLVEQSGRWWLLGTTAR